MERHPSTHYPVESTTQREQERSKAAPSELRFWWGSNSVNPELLSATQHGLREASSHCGHSWYSLAEVRWILMLSSRLMDSTALRFMSDRNGNCEWGLLVSVGAPSSTSSVWPRDELLRRRCFYSRLMCEWVGLKLRFWTLVSSFI